MTGWSAPQQVRQFGGAGRLARILLRLDVARWRYVVHDLVTQRPFRPQGHGSADPAAPIFKSVRVATWCYLFQDLVTRSAHPWHGDPSLRFRASACGAGWHGFNAMADHRVTIVRPVVARKPNARRAESNRPYPTRQVSRPCASMCGGCGGKNTRSPVRGVGRWSRWSSIRARRHGIVTRCVGPRLPARERQRGCAACGSAGRPHRWLRDLQYRNSTARLTAPCWWGVLGEVLMPHAPRHTRVLLLIHVTFEPTRLAADQLVAAYDCLLPGRHPLRRTPTTTPSPAPDERALREQEGA